MSAERVLSGAGLANLHQAIAELEGCESPRRTPSDVTAGAFDGSSPICRATVDAFHRAALAAGARDNGAPGLRPQYHANYYGAFVLDPDGYNIEAVCHLAE